MPDLRNISLKQLRALRAVVEAGSVSAAAQQLSVTPPTIATHLKTLDSLAAGPVLDRSGDSLRPTALGAELLRCAAEIETVIDRAGARLGALSQGAEGHVALGVVSTAKYFAPSIVAAFRRAHPKVKVSLSVGNRSEIIAGLERNAYDLVIMGRPPAHLELHGAILGDHPYVLIAPPGHPLVRRPEARPEDLLKEPFLAREQGSGTRLLANRFLDQLGDGRAFEVVEMSSDETIKQAVIAGLGVALISQHTCEAELAEGRLAVVPTPGLPLIRQWHVLHSAERAPDASAQAFLDFIRKHGPALPPERRLSHAPGPRRGQRPA